MKWVLIGLIKIYRKFISPCIGPHCIYTPTCSQYAMEAIKKYGGVCEATICYTTGPVYTKEYFVKLGKQLEDMGADNILSLIHI